MVQDSLDTKIINQVEYYFGDLNVSRDKFMKQLIQENDGWIPLETMLKFNRLKALTEDLDKISKALEMSTTGLLETGPNGIRRKPSLPLPENFDEVIDGLKDQSVYVKGFDVEASLDEIIEWLEKHGGKTLNVHMRRFPKDKKFKGSVFAVFETKEISKKFVASEDAATYKAVDMIRMFKDVYLKGKKVELDARHEARTKKHAAFEANKEEQMSSRMCPAALLELSGLPQVKKKAPSTTTEDEKPEDVKKETASPDVKKETASPEDVKKEPASPKNVKKETALPEDVKKETASPEDVKKETASPDEAGDKADEPTNQPPTVLALKQWLIDRVGSEFPLAWIDIEPSEGKAIVRFKLANTAEPAFDKLKSTFADKPIVYANCELSGRVLSGDDEEAHWKMILKAQMNKSLKRRGRQNTRGGGFKRRRMN